MWKFEGNFTFQIRSLKSFKKNTESAVLKQRQETSFAFLGAFFLNFEQNPGLYPCKIALIKKKGNGKKLLNSVEIFFL